jgi:hypothetical protein
MNEFKILTNCDMLYYKLLLIKMKLVLQITLTIILSLTSANNIKQFETPAMYIMPRIQKSPEPPHIVHPMSSSVTTMIQSCPCAGKVQCQPCGVIIPILEPQCPCAPKPHCPQCPPLSLIHEIASKKVLTYLL